MAQNFQNSKKINKYTFDLKHLLFIQLVEQSEIMWWAFKKNLCGIQNLKLFNIKVLKKLIFY